MIALMNAGCEGMRVNEITLQTNLSRPAVSHHLKILKNAQIVSMNRRGTMNFYYLDPATSTIGLLKTLTEHIEGHMMEYGFLLPDPAEQD
ncbi:hypothetical protein GCM10010917_08250 [Paenibacillus physcomitrellae]|uniref:HTH arsR-type domain-containing protein n=2 Tax=Paenibacillus physcomitrellae TaxID=1619311 RepID=A0ABQ1FPX6_9BACL|nr:hypothetical protein GCM10010917_08250 [Paenibacillus physcomitrellae]